MGDTIHATFSAMSSGSTDGTTMKVAYSDFAPIPAGNQAFEVEVDLEDAAHYLCDVLGSYASPKEYVADVEAMTPDAQARHVAQAAVALALLAEGVASVSRVLKAVQHRTGTRVTGMGITSTFQSGKPVDPATLPTEAKQELTDAEVEALDFAADMDREWARLTRGTKDVPDGVAASVEDDRHPIDRDPAVDPDVRARVLDTLTDAECNRIAGAVLRHRQPLPVGNLGLKATNAGAYPTQQGGGSPNFNATLPPGITVRHDLATNTYMYSANMPDGSQEWVAFDATNMSGMDAASRHAKVDGP